MALGDYYYYGEQNFEQALEEYVRVQRRQPGNSDALALIAWIQRRQAEWDRSIVNAERALELDPRNPVWLIGQAQNHYYMNRYSEGEPYFQRSIALAPQTPYNYQWTAAFYLAWDGHMERARRTLEDVWSGETADEGDLDWEEEEDDEGEEGDEWGDEGEEEEEDEDEEDDDAWEEWEEEFDEDDDDSLGRKRHGRPEWI